MANLSEMGFPWHLSIICCPHASFHSCKYHFCRAHVGGTDLFYNLNFEYDSFTECAAFLIREGKAPSCFISQHQRIWISLWSGGSALKRQPVCWLSTVGETAIWFENCTQGPHHRISQLILPYTTLRIDIFSQRAELFTVTVICLFLHRWRLPITLRLRCLAQMEMSNKLCLVVGLLHFTAQLYYFKSGVENKSTCQGIMLFLFSRWILEEKVCCRYKKKEITILNSASITSQVLQEWQKCKLLWIVSAIFGYSYSFIASWASLVLQLLCPQRNLDAIFRLPPYVQRFGSNMKARGWARGLSRCGRWWIIQTSGQITSDSPLRLATVESSERAQRPDLPTVGQLAPRAAPTVAPSHFLASSSFPRFPFRSHFSLSTLARSSLPLGRVSTNTFWRAFVSTQFSFFVKVGIVSWPWFRGWF